MKVFVILLMFLPGVSLALDWDASVIVGKWESYSQGYLQTYTELNINPDYSGEYVYISKEKNESIRFSKEKVEFFDGFAVIALDKSLKILVSAWGKHTTSKRLMGQMFYYTTHEGKPSLLNAQPVVFYESDSDGVKNFIKNRVLKR